MSAQQWLGLALQVSIVLTVFGLGLTATWRDATFLFRRPSLLGRAVLSMNVVMPAIAAVVATTSSLPFMVRAALVSLTVSPVPPIIQKKQLAAGGREEYVVGLLVAMSVLAIALVPLTVAILDRVLDRQAVVTSAKIAQIMLMTVLAPLGAGLLIRHWLPAAEHAVGVIRAAAGILLVAGVAILLYVMWPAIRVYIGNGVVLMLAVLAGVGLAVGHLLGGPAAGDRTALALSTSSRHPAVALTIATSGPLSQAKPALAAILLYVVVAAIVAIPYQRWRSRTAAAAQRGGAERT